MHGDDVCTAFVEAGCPSRVLASGEQRERLIEALLTLARSERGLDRPDHLDLSGMVDVVVSAFRPEFERRWYE